MRRSFVFILFVSLIFNLFTPSYGQQPKICSENGCLLSVKHIGDYSKSELETYLEKGVKIENAYSIYTIRYLSSGQEVLATVAIPFQISPPKGGWHIVANNHGTTGIADVCALTGTVMGSGLAGLFGARGFIGIAPDYPGLGTSGIHPYLISESEGSSSLDALRAARNLALKLQIPISNRFAMVGMSQGGHATLAAAQKHKAYAPELDIRAFAVVAPAIVWEEHWKEATKFNGLHLAYHALFVYAWSHYYGFKGPSPWNKEIIPKIDEWMETSCALPPKPNIPWLGHFFSEKAEEIFSPAFLAEYRTAQWRQFSFMRTGFLQNRIGPYLQTAPLRIYQGKQDFVVPEYQTTALVENLKKGGIKLDYILLPSGSHTDIAFGFVAQKQIKTDESIQWIREQLDKTK